MARIDFGAGDQQGQEARAAAGRSQLRGAAGFGFAGLGLFVLMAVLVGVGLLSAVDEAAALSLRYVGSPVLDRWSEVAGYLGSAWVSVAYGVAISFVLWRTGARWWSLAPFAFLFPTAIELGLKSWLSQPPVPPGLRFHVPTGTSLPTLLLDGSFPSGHALRSAFFCTFLAVLIWRTRRPATMLLAMAVLAVAPAVGFAMLYAGWHWLSDVVAGLVLGASVALLVAPQLSRHLKP